MLVTSVMKVSPAPSTLAASIHLLSIPDFVRITKNASAPYELHQPLTRARAKAQGVTTDVEGVIEKVLDQKVTRNKTYCKVCFISKKQNLHLI